MLRAAGDYRIERAIRIDPETVRHLPDLTARGIIHLARSGFTVNAVHAAGPDTAREALGVLHAAATDQGRTIVWCSPTSEHQNLPVSGEHTLQTLTDVYQLLLRGRDIDATTTIIVDCAAQAYPAALSAIADQAASHHARLVLLDRNEVSWRPAPSGPLLKLLQRDLPWTTTLSVHGVTAARRAAQPDLEPVLSLAVRCAPEMLTSEVKNALVEQERVRQEHQASNRVDALIRAAIEVTRSDNSVGLD